MINGSINFIIQFKYDLNYISRFSARKSALYVMMKHNYEFTVHISYLGAQIFSFTL